MTYGYVRISTKDQNIDRQLTSMREQGVLDSNVYVDRQSGKDFNRSAYKKLIRKLKAGDLLLIHELERIGRNYDEILENWRLITKTKMADIRVLDMPILDTTIHKDLLGTLISDIVLQVLSYAAQKMRESMLKSQSEGIVEAKKKGVKFGRPPKSIPANFEAIKSDYFSKRISSRKAADELGVSQKTFLKWVNQK